jgi:hypothetical protein
MIAIALVTAVTIFLFGNSLKKLQKQELRKLTQNIYSL